MPTHPSRPLSGPAISRTKNSVSESGASLVEFALVLPLLLALIFGLIEMSWAFAQTNDVRHGAREGARAAAVDAGDVNAIGQAVCDRMDVVQATQNIVVILTPVSSSPTEPGEGSVGALARMTVTADLKTITGFFDPLLGGKTVSSTIEFRLEQPGGGQGDATWWGPASLGNPSDRYSCP